MLEIVFLIYLCKRIGNVARDKFRKAWVYQVLVILTWFGGEFVGAIASMVIRGTDQLDAIGYLGALIAAGLGVTAMFVLVTHLPTLGRETDRGFEVLSTPPPRR